MGKKEISIILGNIGNVYDDHKDYPKALDYYFKSLKVRKDLGAKILIAGCLNNIGHVYTDTKKYSEAEKYLLQALTIDTTIGSLLFTKNTHDLLSKLYIQTGNFKKAFDHYVKAMVIKDSLFNGDKNKEIARKEMNYEFDKKEIVVKAEQDKKDAITAEETRRQKIITYSVSGGLFLVVLLALFIFRGYRQKQKSNFELAQKNKIIEEKNKNITDSINYAKRIQGAMLPHRKDIWTAFPQSFVLFKPKDIVSGDFYFFHQSLTPIIAVADCTGHGVPGAFMSMVGAGKLNETVSQTTDTSEILSLLNKGIKTALKQTEGDKATRDGMDIALCSVDTENRVVKYAGANRPLWIIRSGQPDVEEIKATKTAIGGLTEDTQHFDTHELKLQQGDTFYICTDGFADQFGGQTGKKLMTKKLKEILLGIQSKTMKEQEQHLDNFVENWKAGTEQVDDILVIGVRL